MAAPKRPTAPTAASTVAAPAERTREQAAAARRDAFENVKPADRGMVDALLAERNGYVHRGLGDRVSQVDEQLRARGYGV